MTEASSFGNSGIKGPLSSLLTEFVDRARGDASGPEIDLTIRCETNALHVEVSPREPTRSAAYPPYGLTLMLTPLTPAEQRVLAYLPTNYTFAAIAEDCCVSRNTVKTQAISVYRKLGVSARHDAVVVARELGLLPASA